jgi:hypothetical protein
MVAAAVLGIAATALFSLLSRSLSNLRTVEDLHHYQLAGQEMMNRVLLTPSFPPGGKTEGRLQTVPGRYSITVTPWIPENLDDKPSEAVMKVAVEILWAGRSGERSLKLEGVKAGPVSYEGYDFAEAIEAALPE